MKFYRSYKEAHEKEHLPGSWQRGTIGSASTGLSSIKLTANPKSLDRISSNLKTIYYVGRGKKGSPGEPVEVQEEIDQQIFFRSLFLQNPVAVLTKLKSGVVVSLGNYKVSAVVPVSKFKPIHYQVTLVHLH
jgi:hypothetical protein